VPKVPSLLWYPLMSRFSRILYSAMARWIISLSRVSIWYFTVILRVSSLPTRSVMLSPPSEVAKSDALSSRMSRVVAFLISLP